MNHFLILDNRQTRVVFLFDNIGPYHAARLSAVGALFHGVAVQFGATSALYDWMAKIPRHIQTKTINPDGAGSELSYCEFNRRLCQALESARPEIIFVNGWGFKGALIAIKWAKIHGSRIVVMSETRRVDGVRSSIGEWVKRRIVRMCDAGLCGGESHRKYLNELGLPHHRVALGYNAVDNPFFSKNRNKKEFSVFSFQFSECNTQSANTTTPYFLASNRFVERKNLRVLIRAYAQYSKSCQAEKEVWPLVLLGDGELRGDLEGLCGELGIKVFSFQGSVFSPEEEGELKLNSYKLKTPPAGGLVVFAGFRQIEELPFFYGGAGAFIHPALSEPWGLVINEAMASGLPILSSKNVGAAEELVRDGINGFSFDPKDTGELAGMLLKLAEMRQEEREAMGEASRRMIANWGPERFAEGAQQAAQAAMLSPQKSLSILDRILLEILIRK